MSSRRNGSVSRAAETASKNRLHMDRNPQHSRINDPSNPAGKRKEIDNLMKRARQASPGSWDRKLLEVEEKDPNRWRHSGYKQMYIEGSDSVSPRRSRSPVLGRRSRSPLARRSRSPVARRSRSPLAARRSPRAEREPRRDKRRTPKRTPPRRSVSPRRRSPARARRPAPPPRPHPPPPNDPRKSTSGSSVSSCSDESCSVCSAKNKKTAPPPPPKGVKLPSRSPTRLRSAGARAVQPTRELLKAREGSKRSREEKVLEWQRTQLGSRGPVTIPACQIKREGDAPVDPRRPPGAGPAGGAPRVSPSTIAAALRRASRSPSGGPAPAPRLTLSERFGKMAAWSQERAPARDNMRITRREATLHVHIEGGGAEDEGSAPASPGAYPAAPGAAPPGTPRWDDVTVRYEHYKERGYLRGLTLADYVKWEEWWYKYQEWLERERAYERWAESPRARRERRRKGPGGGRHRRS